MNRHLTRSTLTVATGGLALSLAACGGSTSSSATSTTSTAAASSATSSATSSMSSSASATSSSSSTSAALPTVQGAVQQMDATFDKTKSAHVVAQQTEGSTTIKIELAGTVDGSNQKGSISNSSTTDGGSVQFVVAGGKQYANGDAAYYKSSDQSAKAAQYAGKWIIVPSGNTHAKFSELTLQDLFKEMKQNFSTAKTAKMKITSTTEDGQAAWQISDGETTGVISADGKARLLRADHKESGQTASYRFSEWDAVPTVTAPAGAIQG